MSDDGWDETLEFLKDTVTAWEAECPGCGRKWLADISAEDIEDGCTPGSPLWCSDCLFNRIDWYGEGKT